MDPIRRRARTPCWRHREIEAPGDNDRKCTQYRVGTVHPKDGAGEGGGNSTTALAQVLDNQTPRDGGEKGEYVDTSP